MSSDGSCASDEAFRPWTIEQHLAAGTRAIDEIERICAGAEAPICHHFDPQPVVPVDCDPTALEELQAKCAKLSERLGLDFDAGLHEIWERVAPTRQWMHARTTEMFDAAASTGWTYLGWTYEPADRQPIHACQIQVINNRIA